MSDPVLPVDALADDLLVAVRDFPIERPFSLDPARGEPERRLCEAYNRLYCELHDRVASPPAPAVLDTLTCARCGGTVHVAQIPAGHIDPARFVGGCCYRVTLSERVKARRYDPATSAWPAGY